MKIVFITDVFSVSKQTSVGIIVGNLAREFKARGHRVLIVAPVADKKEAGLKEYDGLEVNLIYIKAWPRLAHYLGLCNFFVLKEVGKVLNNFQPEVVHAHVIHLIFSYAILKLAKKKGAKVFLTVHDVNLFHPAKLIEFITQDEDLRKGLKNTLRNINYKVNAQQQIRRFKKRFIPWRKKITGYYLRYVDKVFAVSEALAEAHRQNGFKEIVVIYNGIKVSEWQIDGNITNDFKKEYNLIDKRVVLFSGRIRYKGIDKLILALAEIGIRVPSAVLLVIGQDEKDRMTISKLATESRVSVVTTNWLSGDKLKAAYWTSDVVVVPSVCFDSFPNVNLEAMACHKPVIGTCFGGTPEAVEDGVTGFIINPFNVDMLAERIKEILTDGGLGEKMGQAGYERVKNSFSFEKQCDDILNWYKKYVKK